jgi:hypothetical protein
MRLVAGKPAVVMSGAFWQGGIWTIDRRCPGSSLAMALELNVPRSPNPPRASLKTGLGYDGTLVEQADLGTF